jgi:hypothetical protein
VRLDYDIPRHRNLGTELDLLPFSAPAAFDELRPGKAVMDLDIINNNF